jgi:hypothetical protein
LLGHVALEYIAGAGNLSRFSTLGLIDFTFLPMRFGGLASHVGCEEFPRPWICGLDFVIEYKRGTVTSTIGGDLLNWHRVLVRDWDGAPTMDEFEARREARSEKGDFQATCTTTRSKYRLPSIDDEALDQFVGAKVIGRQLDRLQLLISFKGVSREPSGLNLTFIYSNKRNRHVTEGSHRTTRSGGQDKSVAWIDWALTTTFGTVDTANSTNINTKVDHHLLSSEVSEKEVKPAIRCLRGKQVFFSQKWVVLLPFSLRKYFCYCSHVAPMLEFCFFNTSKSDV